MKVSAVRVVGVGFRVSAVRRSPVGLRVAVGPRRVSKIKEDAELLWLIERAQRGDDRATNELLHRYNGLLHKVGQGIRAGDGYEELVVKFLVALRRYEPRPGITFGAYLKQVLTRSAIDHARKWDRRDGKVTFVELDERIVG
ncbi:MAG: helix-turn-helix domain-containing protein [Fimbriimonadaceae bacterium]|nr:helix-turn-helix domain-containing protein [Fimbriimonadaceae bacterium]